MPFSNIVHDTAVLLKVMNGERPERPSGNNAMSDTLWEVVERCWHQNFADRLSTTELIEAIDEVDLNRFGTVTHANLIVSIIGIIQCSATVFRSISVSAIAPRLSRFWSGARGTSYCYHRLLCGFFVEEQHGAASAQFGRRLW